MNIDNLRFEKIGDRLRATATIHWEDCKRPTQDIYFETVDEFAESLSCNPHAFLVACIMPAFYFGEERVSIEGDVCPELIDGLMTNLIWMRHWWCEPARRLVKIETRTRAGIRISRTPERAGFCFSGGVDALATLRDNRLKYPSEHPGSLKDGLFVCGLEIQDPKMFKSVFDSVSVLADDAGVTLIPLYTNIKSLGPEDHKEFWGVLWLNKFMGAAFSAIAHALSKRLTDVTINSSADIAHLVPYSSHPLIDPNYSSCDLRIRHKGIALSRFEKTKLLAGWELALKHLRVCNRTDLYHQGQFNCGKCEKCVRTMLALLALGVLEKASAFPACEINEKLLKTSVQIFPPTLCFYEELINPLRKIGRDDLVRVIKQKIAEYHQSLMDKKKRMKIIQPILEYDRKNFGGNLRKLKRIIYQRGGIWNHS